MLFIFTNKNMVPSEKQCIDDIETQYVLKRSDIINKYEHEKSALEALENIEGMTYHDKG